MSIKNQLLSLRNFKDLNEYESAKASLEAKIGEVINDIFGDSKIYATCQNDDDITWILKYSGQNSLIIGTDYGHTDPSTQIDAISIFRKREDIDQNIKDRVLSVNPKRLYGL